MRCPFCLGVLMMALWPLAAKGQAYPWLDHAPAQTLLQRVAPPEGAQRVKLPPRSFGAWLRTLPLLPEGTPVKLYTGKLKARQDVHAAVVDIDVGPRDRQQCADAVYRLWAEHLWASGQRDALAFHLTNGMALSWTRWAQGERVKVEGHKTRWVRGARPDGSYQAFRRFLDFLFTYAGTSSLARLDSTPLAGLEDLRPGDTLVQGGFPGHAVLVADRAEAKGAAYVLLLQSYMPAQNVHLLKNHHDPKLSPWFRAEGQALTTPEWPFGAVHARRLGAQGRTMP